MGVVYQAWDSELGVAVALKVIRPEVSSDPYAAREVERRFKRELLLARQVTHKHVVRIHDLGEIDGIKYLTMPYIEGRDLAQVLREEGHLGVQQGLRFAKQIADGLLAAHEAGVVHRDLKPENVMIDLENQAQIMDFGISRSVSGPAPGTATAVGAVLGTLEYMAPEQARGVPVDHRADIYSFGLIVHDMFAGRRRLSTSESALAEMMGRMQQPPPPVRTLVPEVPEDLDRIVSRCLHPDPEQRYAKTADLVAELNALDADGRVVRVKPPVMHWRTASAALLVLLIAVVAAVAWMWQQRPPRGQTAAAARDPVSVLIADFDNRAGDPVFDGSLEQALAIAMEGASFITALPHRDAMRAAAQIKPDARLNQEMAQLVSRREGVKVVLAGTVEQQGAGYRITVKAIDALPAREIASASRTASSKAEVLDSIAKVATELRGALGDKDIKSSTIAAEETFTASSLDAVREYSLAQDLASAGKDEDAVVHYRKATEIDANFGRAYSGWALSAFSLGRQDEARTLWNRALSLMNRMTDREKYRTLGLYYVAVAGDYEKAVENYSMLVKLYPADGVGHSNLAVAEFLSLNFAKAVQEGQYAASIYPKNAKFRNNLALYAMYAGDFDRGATEARAVLEQSPGYVKAFLPLAAAAVAADKLPDARAAYSNMARTGVRGASLANMGLSDLALYEGRADEAAATLTNGIADDRRERNVAGLTAKYIALAETQLLAGRNKDVRATVQLALKESRAESVMVASASLLARAGAVDEARKLSAELADRVPNQSRAYAAVIDGEIGLAQGKFVQAIEGFRRALKLADLWLARFGLGVAETQAGLFAQAEPDLEQCLKRRGEATAVFLDDQPTFRELPPVYYWLGRAQEGLQMKSAADHYRRYLAIRGAATLDPLLEDARKRTTP